MSRNALLELVENIKLTVVRIEEGDIKAVRRLLQDPEVDPSIEYNYCIRHACKQGPIEIVKLLLAHPKVNPAADNNEALRNACNFNQIEIVKLLLADTRVSPCDVDISQAIYANHTEMIRLLLTDSRVDPTRHENPFYKAIKYGHNNIVKMLFDDHRVNPNGQDCIRVKEYEIVKIGNVLLSVKNGDEETCQVVAVYDVKEAYLRWKYRIGGEKYNQARASLRN